MATDYKIVLTANYSEKQWAMSGNSYEGIIWLDETMPKPPKEILDAQYSEAKYKLEYAQVSEARRVAYMKESDPVFFQYQRGEKTEQEWLDAVKAINDANPYPKTPKGVNQ
jgi:hypothetical protein